jgi:uncharacterized protein (TIGR02246 family)
VQADQRTVREVDTRWFAAVNGSNVASLLGMMADDAALLNPGRAPVGSADFPAGFLAAHQKYKVLCTSELEEVEIAGKVAYTRSKDSLSSTPSSGGEPIRHAGYRISIYRKSADGQWRLARDVHTLSPVSSI